MSLSNSFFLGSLLSVFLYSIQTNAAMIDLRYEGANGGGYGNSLEFSSDGIGVTVTGYGETGGTNNNPLFETAEVYSWNVGLGVCNQSEGTIGNGCVYSEHEIDTVADKDLIVFEFDQAVEFESITVDPYKNSRNDNINDRDIQYWIGNTLPDLTILGFDDLDGIFGDSTIKYTSRSFNPFTHLLSGTGQYLLLTGADINSPEDAYKILGLEVSPAPIPVPAAFWLFISSLFALAYKKKL